MTYAKFIKLHETDRLNMFELIELLLLLSPFHIA
jgi:hypothetical protein